MRLRNITMIAFLCLLTSGLFAQLFTEDFGGGLPADWTSIEVTGDGSASAVWIHTTTGPAGGIPIAALASTTATNGWMIFDSDLNCSGDQDAWLISPEIDASGVADVWLQFEYYYRTWSDRPQIRVGTDMNDLSSWETIEVYPGITAGQLPDGDDSNPRNANVNLTPFAANQTFRFAFQYLANSDTGNGGGGFGCAYAWEVDDVVVIDFNPLPAIDMRVNAFFAVMPNAITPASQVEAVTFMADIQNVGSGEVMTSTLDIDIMDDAGDNVFNDQLSYLAVGAGLTDENVFFQNAYTPSGETGAHTGTYTITPLDGEDADLSNNQLNFAFEISDTLFSKVLEPTRGVSPADDTRFTYGCIYHVGTAQEANGDPLYARYVQFGITNASDHEGERATIFLYHWMGDVNDDGIINETELIPSPNGLPFLSFNEYEFDGTEDDVILTIPLDIDGNAIPLEDDSYYYVCVVYEGATVFSLLASEEFDYNAMQFVSDSLEMPRYASALDVGNSGELRIVGFGADIVPLVNMTVGPDILDSTKEPVLNAGTVSVIPNPANEVANIKFDLAETSTKVTLELFDTAGKLVKTAQYENVLNSTLTIDVADLANGAYLLHARTDKGIRTVNVTVQH